MFLSFLSDDAQFEVEKFKKGVWHSFVPHFYNCYHHMMYIVPYLLWCIYSDCITHWYYCQHLTIINLNECSVKYHLLKHLFSTSHLKKSWTVCASSLALHLSGSLDIPLVVFSALNIAWWAVVGHHICRAPLHYSSKTYVSGLSPHHLCEVAGVAAKPWVVKVVVLYFIIPHVSGILCGEFGTSLVCQILPHACTQRE